MSSTVQALQQRKERLDEELRIVEKQVRALPKALRALLLQERVSSLFSPLHSG